MAKRVKASEIHGVGYWRNDQEGAVYLESILRMAARDLPRTPGTPGAPAFVATALAHGTLVPVPTEAGWAAHDGLGPWIMADVRRSYRLLAIKFDRAAYVAPSAGADPVMARVTCNVAFESGHRGDQWRCAVVFTARTADGRGHLQSLGPLTDRPCSEYPGQCTEERRGLLDGDPVTWSGSELSRRIASAWRECGRTILADVRATETARGIYVGQHAATGAGRVPLD